MLIRSSIGELLSLYVVLKTPCSAEKAVKYVLPYINITLHAYTEDKEGIAEMDNQEKQVSQVIQNKRIASSFVKGIDTFHVYTRDMVTCLFWRLETHLGMSRFQASPNKLSFWLHSSTKGFRRPILRILCSDSQTNLSE